ACGRSRDSTNHTTHDHDVVCEEDHYGDPTTGATAICPRARDAGGVARLSPHHPGAQVQWFSTRAAPPAGGAAVGVVPARTRATHGRRRTQLVPARPGQ